jgi:branched-chain amino acid transport system permease protein
MGALIIGIVVFFPLGIMGWIQERWPERFGYRVEKNSVLNTSKGGQV